MKHGKGTDAMDTTTGARARFGQRLLRETSGAVYAEAVVMLPFFILILGCILWVHTYYSRRIELGARAKACAWIYANSACGQLPPDCAGLVVQNSGTISVDALPPSDANDVQAFIRLLPSSISLVPMLSTVGQGTAVSNQRVLTQPPVLGGSAVTVFSNQSVMCNERTTSPGDVTREIFCSLTNLC